MLSFVLFKMLNTEEFSVWANSNACMYIILLWLDCGFRKSVPRFAPEFAQNKHAMQKFIRNLFCFQGILLTATLPLFIGFLWYIAPMPIQNYGCSFLLLMSVLFISEGIRSLFQRIYHAYFWHKQFNLLHIGSLTTEIAVTMTLISFLKTNTLIYAIFCIKSIRSVSVSLYSWYMLNHLYKDKDYQHNSTINTKQLYRNFITHSGIMWTSTSAKSLTERNVLLPLLTYILGPAPANIFKLANDCALLFYRTIIKTIGSTDTALLAHAKVLGDRKLSIAFSQLKRKTLLLCMPLVTVVIAICLVAGKYNNQNTILHIFMILIVGYLFEFILSPYERLLEINHKYKTLFICYLPYFILLACLFITPISNKFSIVGLMLLIHGIRLLSSALMVIMIWYQS